MGHLVALGIVSILLFHNSAAFAEGPGERLTNATARVLAVLQGGPPREPGASDERREQIQTILNEMFDWQEISRQVLSQHWELLSPPERDEFAALFGDVLQRSYLTMIHSYQGQEIAMVLLEETVDADRAAVRTKLLLRSEGVSVTYRFVDHDNSVWKVYDVSIDGVSVLSSSRAQIGRLIRLFGFGGMMNVLRMKQNQLAVGENARGTKVSRVDASP